MDVSARRTKCNKVGITIEHTIAGCSSLYESASLRQHNQMAKIIHQQTAIMHKLLNGSTTLYYRYKLELVLGSTNMILYWEGSIVIWEKVDCNRPDMVLIVRENTTAPVIDVAVPLAHNLTKTEIKKIMN